MIAKLLISKSKLSILQTIMLIKVLIKNVKT